MALLIDNVIDVVKYNVANLHTAQPEQSAQKIR
jgi:hypothetical protein